MIISFFAIKHNGEIEGPRNLEWGRYPDDLLASSNHPPMPHGGGENKKHKWKAALPGGVGGCYARRPSFAVRASCRVWEKFRFAFSAAVFSHSGMVNVFFTARLEIRLR